MVVERGTAMLEEPLPGSPFEGLSLTFDFYAEEPVVASTPWLPKRRVKKEECYVPAAMLFALVWWRQRRRTGRAMPGDRCLRGGP